MTGTMVGLCGSSVWSLAVTSVRRRIGLGAVGRAGRSGALQKRWGKHPNKRNPAIGWAMGAGGLGFAPLRQHAAEATNAAQPCVLVLWGKPKNRTMPPRHRAEKKKRRHLVVRKRERTKPYRGQRKKTCGLRQKKIHSSKKA